MRENCDFVVPVNILTKFARPVFMGHTTHYTVCLDALFLRLFLYLYQCQEYHQRRASHLKQEILVKWQMLSHSI